MPRVSLPSAHSRVATLAAQTNVHDAFRWLHLNEKRILDWQEELVSIPSPPFAERVRAEHLAERFRQLGLAEVGIDSAGNVTGISPAGSSDIEGPAFCVLVSAHIDTVFPEGTEVAPQRNGLRLHAPGACDNGAGVAALLAIAAAFTHLDSRHRQRDIVFAGNVGEEGEGDLRGIRHIYDHAPWRDRIASHIVLDGAGHELVVTQALGSRRFLATIAGPGGHSWTDSGAPNPIVILSRAISELAETKRSTTSRSVLNVGTIAGGTSVNAIPQTASARFDLRSTDPEELVKLETELVRAIEEAVDEANRQPRKTKPGNGSRARVTYSIEKIGDRPAASLPQDALVMQTLRAVDRHLGIRTEERLASTDANIPLSLGVEAVSVGAGGDGGAVHTTAEWYDAANRILGLKRILLLVLALA